MTTHPTLFDPGIAAEVASTGHLPITARVHDELRAAVLRSAAPLAETQSDAVRRLVLSALRLEDALGLPVDPDVVVQTLTSRLTASVENRGDTTRRPAPDLRLPKRRGTQRERAVRLATRTTPILGATVDELEEVLERETGQRQKVNGLARRMTDALQAGAVRPAMELDANMAGRPADGALGPYDALHRPTRAGTPATVYIATPAGREWLATIDSRFPA